MILIKYFLLIAIFTQTYALETLQKTYYTDSNDINLSSIFKDTKNDKKLFEIQSNKYSKRIKSKLLIKILSQLGYKDIKSKSNYITFKRKTTFDTSKIKTEINNYYKNNYELIHIIDIFIQPREYMQTLPKEFVVEIRKRNFLSNKGIISIKTDKRRKYFFDYTIKAIIPVCITNQKLKKNTAISVLNTQIKSIILDKIRAKPIQKIIKNSLQAKYNISKNKILTIQNTEKLKVIKRGSIVNVILHNNGIDISFSAKALKDARVDDTITVENNNKRKFKVKVIGKNKTEMW